MRPSRHGWRGSLLAAAVFLQACAGASGPPPEAAPPVSSRPSTAELEALYRARLDSALMNVSEADVRFMTGMIHHHAQALVMSALAPRNGAGPAIRTLTARIINAQKDEIATMQQWLRDRGRPVPEVLDDGRVVEAGGAPGGMLMPGMLSPEQIAELQAARDGEFDRMFLRYMIQHHQGAVTMVHDLFATDGAAQDELVFRIASDIQVDQITEIERMRSMLAEMRSSDDGR